jgi:hypothetical protein
MHSGLFFLVYITQIIVILNINIFLKDFYLTTNAIAGLIIVPLLTSVFGIYIRYAIGASLVSVIATSCPAASTYSRFKVNEVYIIYNPKPCRDVALLRLYATSMCCKHFWNWYKRVDTLKCFFVYKSVFNHFYLSFQKEIIFALTLFQP